MNFTTYFKNVAYLFVLFGVSTAIAGSYEDFFTALQRNDAAAVTRLLERGFDPNTRDPEGRPGLYAALQRESYDAALALVHHPAIDVNALNSNDESPLMIVALKGQLQWGTRLLERGAAVNKPGWTPLHYAASGTEPQMLALLLDKGALINAPSPNGSTPLMMAALYGPDSSVQLLLNRGADAKQKNDLGMTVVDFAARGGRDKLAEQMRKALLR